MIKQAFTHIAVEGIKIRLGCWGGQFGMSVVAQIEGNFPYR